MAERYSKDFETPEEAVRVIGTAIYQNEQIIKSSKSTSPEFKKAKAALVKLRAEFKKASDAVDAKRAAEKNKKPVVNAADAARQFPVMKTLTDKQEAYKLYDELKLKYEKR